MATKFNLRQQVLATSRTNTTAQQAIFEGVLTLHGGDRAAATLCVEGVVDILGTLHARMANGQPILTDKDPRAQKTLMGIVAGAKVLMDYPEAAEAHNLTPNRLRQVVQQADLNTNAAQTMLAVAGSAPTVVGDVVKLIHGYNQAVEKGDQPAMEAAKRTIQQLWLHWQRATPQSPVAVTA